LVLPRFRTVFFVHGCFWHGHAGCRYFVKPKTRTKFWLEKIGRNRLRDKRNYCKLLTEGWNIVVIWECATRADASFRLLMEHLAASLRKSDESSISGDHQELSFCEFGEHWNRQQQGKRTARRS
jgi:DNA mismatch endonuclease (patch repair protein)